MTNDEKRDRKLRETFEQCLSGIDTLPSQRAEISKKLADAPARTGRIAFRAIALPAALTLLLCAGIGVFSGLQGSQPYPDPLKTDATLVAEKPLPTDFVPLAQPEGEGGTDTVVLEGNSVTWDEWGAVVPTVEPVPEANVQAVWFFSRWRDHKWAELLEMCSQEWRDRQPDPAASLADLTGFMTPDTLEFDAITGIKETEDAGYVMNVTVSDIEKPETQYMISLNVKKENGGLWYINPDSLKDYTVLAPRHLPETAEEEIPEEEQLMQALVQADPVLAASLVPIGLSCESSGIKLEIISAALSKEGALVVYSLEDLEGSRLTGDPNLEFPILSLGPSYDESSWSTYLPYRYVDPAANKVILAACTSFLEPADLTDFDRTAALSMIDLRTLHELEIDLIPLLREYGGQPRALTSPPIVTNGHIHRVPWDTRFTDSQIRDLGVKVLDPAGSREIPLSDYVILSGIDLDKDGILHVQLRYPKSYGYTYPTIQSASGIIQEEDFIQPDRPSHLYWDGNSRVPGPWLEVQLKLNGEIRDDASLIMTADCFSTAVSGTWSIEIPTEQIWVSTGEIAEAAETPAAEPEETAEAKIIPYANTRLLKCIQLWRAENWQGLLDLCVPAWKEQAADPLETLKVLFPFGNPEIVDSAPLKSSETEYTADCILRSRSARETWYHAAVSMRKEADGLWYLDPESLQDCKAMTAEEILKFRMARAESRRDYYFPSADAGTVTSSDPMSFIKSNHPSLVDSLVPLGLTCESDGIRLEIISAAIQEEGSLILYSLKDLTGDRVGRHEEYAPWLHISGVDYPMDGWSVSYLEQDAEEHYASYAMYIPGDQLYNIEGNLNCSLSRDLLFYKEKEVDLLPLLRKYEDRTWKLVDLPENAIPFPDYPEYRKYAKEMDIKVLDSTDSLDIPIAENVTLDGIGYPEDGRLHIRMHVVNNGKLADSSGYEYRPIFNVSAWRPFVEYNPSEEVSMIEWATDEDGAESWVEYAYRCTRESLNKEGLKAAVYITSSFAHGPWKIEIQTDSVRK